MMDKSHDWFCAPGSHKWLLVISVVFQKHWSKSCLACFSQRLTVFLLNICINLRNAQHSWRSQSHNAPFNQLKTLAHSPQTLSSLDASGSNDPPDTEMFWALNNRFFFNTAAHKTRRVHQRPRLRRTHAEGPAAESFKARGDGYWHTHTRPTQAFLKIHPTKP